MGSVHLCSSLSIDFRKYLRWKQYFKLFEQKWFLYALKYLYRADSFKYLKIYDENSLKKIDKIQFLVFIVVSDSWSYLCMNGFVDILGSSIRPQVQLHKTF